MQRRHGTERSGEERHRGVGNVTFETAHPAYDWLNRCLAVGCGFRRADGPVYSVFEVL